MKYSKMLGFLAVAVAGLMAFAGTASATLTNANGTNATSFHAKLSGATSTTGTLTVTCQKSTLGASITTNDANHASGPVTTLTFEECGSVTVTVVAGGSLTFTDADGTTGNVLSSNLKVTKLVHNIFLGTIHCTYITPAGGTKIGTFTESTHAPSGGSRHTTATIHILGVLLIEWATSDDPCGDPTWEGTYEVTSPDELFLD